MWSETHIAHMHWHLSSTKSAKYMNHILSDIVTHFLPLIYSSACSLSHRNVQLYPVLVLNGDVRALWFNVAKVIYDIWVVANTYDSESVCVEKKTMVWLCKLFALDKISSVYFQATNRASHETKRIPLVSSVIFQYTAETVY